MSKALRKQGAEVLSEKKCPLPVNGLHSGLKTGHRGASLWRRFASAPQVFPAFAVGETPAPERSEGERGGFHAAKALRKQGQEHVGRRSSPVTGYQWTTEGFTEYFYAILGKSPPSGFFRGLPGEPALTSVAAIEHLLQRFHRQYYRNI